MQKKFTRHNRKSHAQGRKGGSNARIITGAAGAVAGAALGATTAMLLQNEKTRAKLGKVVGDVTSRALDHAETDIESGLPKVKRAVQRKVQN